MSFSFFQRLSLLLQDDLLKSFLKGSSFPRGKKIISMRAFGETQVVLIFYLFIQHMYMEQLLCAWQAATCSMDHMNRTESLL